ncbi:MAG: hypothetical protein ACLGQX_09920, partial [Acidobacteriota bacterium]
MLQDEETVKLYAAGYEEEDETGEIADMDSLDEEEEEEFNLISVNRVEEAELFAPVSGTASSEPPFQAAQAPAPSTPPKTPRKAPAKKAAKAPA